jgi:malate dehydrogenase (oxaloacetate-decarboxylating)(NADP+)
MSASNTGAGKRGIELLHDPRINKSTGFTEAERQSLGLVGLVPDVTESIDTQLTRVLLQLKGKATDLDRFIHLMNLLETNRTLFYRTLMSDPARFLEIVYDPTIGEACLKFDTSSAARSGCICRSAARGTSRRCYATGQSKTCVSSA